MDRSLYPDGTDAVYESGGYLSVEDAKFLAALTLDELVLTDTSISPKALEAFKGQTWLTTLDLSHSYYVTDEDLAYFRDLQRLREVTLCSTHVGDVGLEHLKTLTRLEKLDLSGTGVTDAGLEHLTGLTHLKELWLVKTNVTDEGLKYLTGLKGLRTLMLFRTAVTEGGMATLRQALVDCDVWAY